MRILLIGGTGIISTEISNLCIEKGYEVDIINRGRRREFVNDKVSLIVADVRMESENDIKQKIGNKQYDVVFDFITYNVVQMKKTLSIIADCCKQYVFVSSATAYADCDGIIDETVELNNNKWKYAQDKAECERYLELHSKEYGIEYTIIRPYVTYNKTRIPYQIIPLQYYTIINRIKCGKPLPIYGNNVKCTLTSSKDFAVAAVGLCLNQVAYGEAYHITSDCVMTWNEVGETLAKYYGKDVNYINIPEALLKKGSKELGFNVEEILGDKARNMVFTNKKIKEAVPEFVGNKMFEEMLSESIEYFESSCEKQVINYEWDARIDNLLVKSVGKDSPLRKRLNLSSFDNKMTVKEKYVYVFNRYNCLRFVYRVVRKLRRGR